jgi:16S rRNA (cytidine1402-2'-O)-methyltransferase
VPGASAVTAAVASAGLPTDRFFFEGFLPPREQARRARLTELARRWKSKICGYVHQEDR